MTILFYKKITRFFKSFFDFLKMDKNKNVQNSKVKILFEIFFIFFDSDDDGLFHFFDFYFL